MLSAEILVQCPLLDRINFMDTEAMAVRCWTQAVELVSASFNHKATLIVYKASWNASIKHIIIGITINLM